MDESLSNPLACINVGSKSDNLSCCFRNDLNSDTCQTIFEAGNGTLAKGCQIPTDDCIAQCRNVPFIYGSLVQNGYFEANGIGPISRYAACINMPSISRAFAFNELPSNISGPFQRIVRENATNVTTGELEDMTSAVTECLTSTCSASRHPWLCEDKCSSVKILSNNTNPNLTAIDGCLDQLCNLNGYSSLPYADTDIVGIGVFASYIMQCGLLVIFWFCFCYFLIKPHPKDRKPRQQKDTKETFQLAFLRKKSSSSPTKKTTGTEATESTRNGAQPENYQQNIDSRLETWKNLLEDFHKAQCWFVGSLMVASFVNGVYDTNTLIILMLIPPTLNGILPTVFAYFLLMYYQGVDNYITFLTVIVYVLSSVVYWSLYSQIIPLSSRLEDYNAFGQFTYKLSSNRACGGHSALAVCPDYNQNLKGSGDSAAGFQAVQHALHKLRVLTPLIWTISTFLLLSLLLYFYLGVVKTHCTRLKQNTLFGLAPNIIVLVVVTAVFLAGIGMQLSLLAIATSLKMMNLSKWTFGQVVAITIWVPTVAEALWNI